MLRQGNVYREYTRKPIISMFMVDNDGEAEVLQDLNDWLEYNTREAQHFQVAVNTLAI